jgi:hypothetical protein
MRADERKGNAQHSISRHTPRMATNTVTDEPPDRAAPPSRMVTSRLAGIFGFPDRATT